MGLLCCLSALISQVIMLIQLLIVPAILILLLIVIYAIVTAKHPPAIEVYESEKAFKHSNDSGMLHCEIQVNSKHTFKMFKDKLIDIHGPAFLFCCR